MGHNDLGYLKDYGEWILSGVLISYGVLYSYLHNYLEIEDDAD